MVQTWIVEARPLLGVDDIAAHLEQAALRRGAPSPQAALPEIADEVVRVLSATRSTWNVHHIRAEAHRQSRSIATPDRDALVEQIVNTVTDPTRAIRIDTPRLVEEPVPLQRRDGESVFIEHASTRFTTTEILDAEERILAAARRGHAQRIDVGAVQKSITHSAAAGRELNAGQQRLVRAFCLSGKAVQLGLAPAGAGKTTALRAVANAWTSTGHLVLALAPSAAAADVLAHELGVQTDTVAKFDHDQDEIPYRAMILVDEAGMTGTLMLDRLVQRARDAGAVVRLVGDDRQLGAVEAGGVIRQLAYDVGAIRMEQVVRFADPADAQATLLVREGQVAALDFYLSRQRVTAGATETIPDAAYQGWLADVRAGRDSLLLAPSSTEVSALNARARADLVLAGRVAVDGVALRDGNVAGVGDHVATRRNERLLTVHGGRDWVKNGDSWLVERVLEDGALTVAHRRHRGRVTLSAEYVHAHVELDYARTIRRSQGLTVDRAHLIVDPTMVREDLYVGLSRARQSTQLYVEVLSDRGPDHQPDVAGSAAEVLQSIIRRTGSELSALQTIREAIASTDDLHRTALEYEHALGMQTGDRYRESAERIRPGLTGDPAWPSVVHRLHVAEANGWDAETALRTAERMRDWTDARSDAQIMAHRLDVLIGHHDHEARDAPVPSWLAASSPRGLQAPWDEYLPRRYGEMADRITTLVAGAEATAPSWLGEIGHGKARGTALREVVAYRAVWNVNTNDPLGAEPRQQTQQHSAWTSASRAVRASHNAEQPSGTERLQAALALEPAPLDVDAMAAECRGSTRHI
nr:AAA family ATPase [Microlunatus elymi]